MDSIIRFLGGETDCVAGSGFVAGGVVLTVRRERTGIPGDCE